MKKILVIIIVCMTLVGCGRESSYQTITAEKANEMMEENVVILDVRNSEEYQNMHIKNAMNLSVERINQDTISNIVKDKNMTILVYCQTGARSEKAAQKLVDLGYTKVYNFGGIIDWPYGLVKEK